MMILRHSILLFLLVTPPAFGQINNAGSLTAYVDSLITAIPDVTPSNLYQVPSVSNAAVWQGIITKLLNGSYSAAHADALTIDYEVVHFTDTGNSRLYYILRKKGSGANYWGTFIVDPDPLRSRLFIQAPHPIFDTNSGNQAIVVYKNTAARAFILAGTHRCNSTALSSCDGSTAVCGGSSQFRKSDQAHNDDGPFQLTTEVFKDAVPNLIVVQLHGFVKDPGYPDLILGNGTQSTPANDWLVKFKTELSALDNTLTYKVAHQDLAWSDLTGTTNTQGRLINNSPNPCGTAASSPTGRFLHIEQAYTGLRDNATSYAKVAMAIGNTFPPDKVIASASTGNWENSSTWVGSIVPNDTTHVVISAGHTVTVTTSGALAKSLSFSDNSASIALASGADLSIRGDLNLASRSHHAFSSWASGATLTFAGGEEQVLNGWNKDSTDFSTSLMEVVVNKSGGKLVTAGDEMNLNIGTALTIASGTFELTAGDDIEGRTLNGSAPSVPSITVQSAGTFTIGGDSSYIRSGTSDTVAVGLLRNFGTVNIAGTDLNQGYNFADIYNEAGGTIAISTGWAASRLLRTDTLLLKAGSLFSTSTTTNILTSAGRTVLNAGGTYRVLGSSVNFSSFFTNNGIVEYAAAGAQTVNNRDYKKLLLSNSGIKTLTLTANRTIDTLELYGSAALTITSASSFDLGVNKSLIMSGGNIVTSSDTLVLGQSGSLLSSLSRSSGAVSGNVKRYIAASTASNIVLPLGNATAYRPVTLSVTGAPSKAGAVAGSFVSSDPGTSGLPLNDGGTSIIHSASEGYWKLAPADALTGGTYTVSAAGEGFGGISTVVSLRLLTRPVSGAWQLQGTHAAGSGSVASPFVSRTGITVLQEFGVGAAADNPLPVELVSFSAHSVAGGVLLRWSTAMETNNYGFEIERKYAVPLAIDPMNQWPNEPISTWLSLGFVPGNGTTSVPKEYSFRDGTGFGRTLYRLRQIDRSGASRYSHEVVVSGSAVPARFSLEQNYPNPFNPGTVLRYQLSASGTTTLRVFDAVGRVVAELVNAVKEPGTYTVLFDGAHLPSGVYIARLSNAGRTEVRRMVLLK